MFFAIIMPIILFILVGSLCAFLIWTTKKQREYQKDKIKRERENNEYLRQIAESQKKNEG